MHMRNRRAFNLQHRVLMMVLISVFCAVCGQPAALFAQESDRSTLLPETGDVPVLASLENATTSEMRDVVERYSNDRYALLRRYDAALSPVRRARLRTFYQTWLDRLQAMDFDHLSVEGRIDYVLLVNDIQYEIYQLERQEVLFTEIEPVVPFATTILRLHEARRDGPSIDARAAADTLNALLDVVHQLQSDLSAAVEEDTGGGRNRPSPIVTYRAVDALGELRETLEDWYEFYDGYDPLFTWWAAVPYKKLDHAIDTYIAFLREKVIGIREGGEEPIIGDPIGADAMRADLIHEMIPYSPEELIAIGEREFAWCEAEMKKASRQMGFGDNWKAALEKVKTLHVEPGEQPKLVHDLAQEAVAFVKEHDLVTVPPLAEEIWRTQMMSPERQKVNPFFTGGEVISVSFPTDEMDHADKLMSMRGNNIHFSRATVHHELIPGHHLQGFMTRRYNPHRQTFSTPFWTEGWALYWEMLLWDLDFPKTPEDRMGMLFWRMHRAARIIFSLRFHLGTMTPQEAIDFLVDRVGHERANATAEVRRSFNGTYPPLYQAGYMLGGMQIRALHEELVESGKMTNREFHDAILQGGYMPIEMIRARLTEQMIPRDYVANWRFAGDPIE